MFGYRNDTAHEIERIVRDAEHRIRSLSGDMSGRSGATTGLMDRVSDLLGSWSRGSWTGGHGSSWMPSSGSGSWWPSASGRSSWWPSTSSSWTGNGMGAQAHALADRAWDNAAYAGREAGRTVGRHPFAFLAVAVGLGVLASMVGRR